MAESNLTFRQKCGIAIITVTGPIMALMYWAISALHAIPLLVFLILAAVGGGWGMALMSPRLLRTAGIFCGILMGLGSFALHFYYSTFRSEMWNYESALVGFLGALPGILLYLGLRKWKLRRLSADPSATSNTVDPDLAALRDDPLFVRNPANRDVVMSEFTKQLMLVGCVFTGVVFAAFLLLLIVSLSQFSEAKAMPKCIVVSYTQFIKDHPRTGWYRIQDCLMDLREAVYTVNPPEGKDPHGHVAYAYIPIHGGAGSKEANTQLLVSTDSGADSPLYSRLEEIEAVRESNPTNAAEILKTQQERLVLKRDVQGILATGDDVYPTSLLKDLSSCKPPLSHDFVVVKDGDNPSVSGSLNNIMVGTAFCAVTLPVFIFLLGRYRRANRR